MSKNYVLKFLILRTIGNFLLLFALFGVVATFGPSLYLEALFKLSQIQNIHYQISQRTQPPDFSTQPPKNSTENNTTSLTFASILAQNGEHILTPKDTDFSIIIPKIGASSKVIPNVDSTNEDEFLKALRIGVAHAKGTVFPGNAGTTYLFAHSSDNFWDVGRYNAVFYLLKDLVPGDDITLFFENRRYNYLVSGSRITNAEDVSYILKSHESNQQQLIMQTCWPPGTTWKRLLVFAKPK